MRSDDTKLAARSETASSRLGFVEAALHAHTHANAYAVVPNHANSSKPIAPPVAIPITRVCTVIRRRSPVDDADVTDDTVAADDADEGIDSRRIFVVWTDDCRVGGRGRVRVRRGMIDRGKSIPHLRCVTVDITVVTIIRTPTLTLTGRTTTTSEAKRTAVQ